MGVNVCARALVCKGRMERGRKTEGEKVCVCVCVGGGGGGEKIPVDIWREGVGEWKERREREKGDRLG